MSERLDDLLVRLDRHRKAEAENAETLKEKPSYPWKNRRKYKKDGTRWTRRYPESLILDILLWIEAESVGPKAASRILNISLGRITMWQKRKRDGLRVTRARGANRGDFSDIFKSLKR